MAVAQNHRRAVGSWKSAAGSMVWARECFGRSLGISRPGRWPAVRAGGSMIGQLRRRFRNVCRSTLLVNHRQDSVMPRQTIRRRDRNRICSGQRSRVTGLHKAARLRLQDRSVAKRHGGDLQLNNIALGERECGQERGLISYCSIASSQAVVHGRPALFDEVGEQVDVVGLHVPPKPLPGNDRRVVMLVSGRPHPAGRRRPCPSSSWR